MSVWSPQEHMQLVCGKDALAPMNKFACKLSWYIVYFYLKCSMVIAADYILGRRISPATACQAMMHEITSKLMATLGYCFT